MITNMFVHVLCNLIPQRSEAVIPATAPRMIVTKQQSNKATCVCLSDPPKNITSSWVRGPKCTHVGSKNEAWRGTPSTFGSHFRSFWVSWRSWTLWASADGLFALLSSSLRELLSSSWVDSRGVLEGLGEVLGVTLGPNMAAKSRKYWKMCGSKRQAVPERVFDSCCVEVKQPRSQILYLSLGIPVSNAYRRFQHRHRILFVLGANVVPCWLPES